MEKSEEIPSEEIQKEVISELYPKAVTIEGTKKILEQMEKCICKIYRNDGNKGTGFFCNINYENKTIPVMMTNFHIIDDKYIKENSKISISFNDDKEFKDIKIKDRIIYTNEEVDVTIIEIKKKDKINNLMELDKRYLINQNIIFERSIYIIQYPLGEKASVSYGVINNIDKDKNNLEYYCNTESGASGSPIINIKNHQIIGIHKEGLIKTKANRGALLKNPINAFIKKKYKIKEEIDEATIESVEKKEIKNNKRIKNKEKNNEKGEIDFRASVIKEGININEKNEKEEINNEQINEKIIDNTIAEEEEINDDAINEIELIINVEEEDINKEIYFLDNINFIDEKKVKHCHDNLKELNESNTELYINNNKCKFKKYFKPENEGEYEIKLKFNNIKDCSFMFAGCENIISINFINFNTKNVKDMKYMFSGCTNLKNLDLSEFNTENVTNMEGMFGQYDNLSYLDLNSTCAINNFNELNIFKKKIKVYYKGCIRLRTLNLPSCFNTQKVINMMGMFSECNNLKILDFPSSFSTQNVTNMMYMFYNCKKLENLSLPSSFETKKVANMMDMLAGCCEVLNLSML